MTRTGTAIAAAAMALVIAVVAHQLMTSSSIRPVATVFDDAVFESDLAQPTSRHFAWLVEDRLRERMAGRFAISFAPDAMQTFFDAHLRQ